MNLSSPLRLPLLVALVSVAMPCAAASPGLEQLQVLTAPGEVTLGIATFKQKTAPTAAQVATLRGLGLHAQGLKRLPMAFVRGTPTQLATAVRQGAVLDVYPNRLLVRHWADSNHTINVPALHALGFTGKGLQVAVVDGGLDATHPDLADHVVHNVKIISPEYAGLPTNTPPGPLVISVDEGPYSNTDAGGGHGTAVAGIIAADGTTSPAQVGVAPDAELIGYATGESVTVLATIAAFDHILDHPEWGIDVVNNSWGAVGWRSYDPGDPTLIATKALADQGIAVVFSAGNDGKGNTEMTLNYYSLAPWVMSIASSTVGGRRSEFSSNGLTMDNATFAPLADGHARFEGDRVGIYRPTVTAPGSDIETSCSTGANDGSFPGCIPGQTGSGSGTSFAAPQVTGLIALLRQAHPGLSVDQLRRTLEATATSVPGVMLWQAGYGLVDAAAALELVRGSNFEPQLEKLHREAGARILAARDWQVPVTEQWSWISPALAVPAAPDTREFTLAVPTGTDALKLTLAFPNPADPTGNRVTDYSVTVLDAQGNELGVTVASATVGVSTLLLDLRKLSPAPAFGEWTLRVVGTLGFATAGVYDGAFTGKTVTLQAALLKAQQRASPPVPAAESACNLPGVLVVSDPANDTQTGQAAYDVLSLFVAEPADIPGKIALTMKVQDLSAPPPNSLWPYVFHTPTPPANGTHWFVGMHTEAGIPTFVYGTVDVQDAGGLAVYTIEGAIDAASNFTPDGTITLIADKALFGLEAGVEMSKIDSSPRPIASASAPIAFGGQDAIGEGRYVVAGNLPCSNDRAKKSGASAEGRGLLLGGLSGSWLLLLGLGFLLRRCRWLLKN